MSIDNSTPANEKVSPHYTQEDSRFTQTNTDGKPRNTTGWFNLTQASIDDNLVTDRPDFTESTEAIPVNRFQLEMGYTFTYDREGDRRTRDHTAPELLLRMGVVENFELRFGWTGYSMTETLSTQRNSERRRVTSEEWNQGANDFELGFKLKIAEQSGLRPALAILGAATFPTGSANISAGDVEPLLGLLWAYDLSDDIALAGQFIVGTPVEDGRRFVQSAASLSLGASLTERLGTYVEYFGTYPNTLDGDSAHSINGGFTYLVNNNLQIDIRAGFGLNDAADDFFTGAGLAWRF
ncbi:MAG: transporter [Planctomycetes bacterium]|nr:transporter [Planctomycetota bacterium]